MDQNIIDICSAAQFEKNRSGKVPKSYEKRLIKHLENENLSFTDKVRCLECLEDYNISYQELQKLTHLDLETVIKKEISSMYFVNHLTYTHMLKVEKNKKNKNNKSKNYKKIENHKKEDGFFSSIFTNLSSYFYKETKNETKNETTNELKTENEINEINEKNKETKKEEINPIYKIEIDLFKFLATSNTIVRGNNLYRAVQLICVEKKPKYLAGVGMLYEMESVHKVDKIGSKIIEKHVYETLLNEYYYNNQDNMMLYLVPVLQLFQTHQLLTVEICEIAIRLSQNDVEMTQDLADFFIHNLRNYVNYNEDFRRFVEWGERFVQRVERVEGVEVNQVLTSSQSVHLLDSNRQKFMEWLNEKSQDFDLEDKKCLKMQAFEKLKNKIYESAKTTEYIKVKTTLDRFQNDNTNIIYTKNSEFQSSLSDIFNRICYIVANHELSHILFQRLLEELVDSAGTCFSGHLNRLFNVFSGFETGLVGIDILQELERTLKVHLQNIYYAADENMQEKIMDLLSGEEINELKGINELNELKNYLQIEIKKVYHKLHQEFDKQIEIEKFNEKFLSVVNVFYFNVIDMTEIIEK